VEVQTGLVAPAIQTWGFIKVEGTLRVFFIYILNTINNDFDNRNDNQWTSCCPDLISAHHWLWRLILFLATGFEKQEP
jgi:hypothetical protein